MDTHIGKKKPSMLFISIHENSKWHIALKAKTVGIIEENTDLAYAIFS